MSGLPLPAQEDPAGPRPAPQAIRQGVGKQRAASAAAGSSGGGGKAAAAAAAGAAAAAAPAGPASAAAGQAPDLGVLPLGPEVSFAARYRNKRAALSAGFDALGLAVFLVSVQQRHADTAPIPRSGVAHLLTLGALMGAGVAAWLAGGRARAAYVRHLEVTALVLRLQLFGMAFRGAGWTLTKHRLDGPPSPVVAAVGSTPSPGGLAAAVQHCSHLMLLLFAGGALPIVHVIIGRPMRLWLSVAATLALLAHSMAWADHMCTAGQLVTPAARGHTQTLFTLLAPVGYLSPLPVFSVAHFAPPADAVQCATLLRFFQLASGLGALAWQAATQAELHAAHQWQRQRAGLPPEHGVSARLYALVRDYTDQVMRPYMWLAAALAAGLCWQLALGVSMAASLA